MNKDVQGEKCVRDDNCRLTLNEEAKLPAWKTHFVTNARKTPFQKKENIFCIC